MPELVFPQGVLIRFIWTRSGEDIAVNVMAALNPGAAAIDQTFANTLGAAVKASLTSSGLAGNLSNVYALSKVGVRDINEANRAEFLDAGAAVVGGDATHPLPPQTALVITLRTALAGRSYRGRVYMTGFAENANTAAGLCADSVAGVANAFITDARADMGASGLTPVVLSRPRPAVVAPLPPRDAWAGAATPIVSNLYRNLVWDTQRRRSYPGI